MRINDLSLRLTNSMDNNASFQEELSLCVAPLGLDSVFFAHPGLSGLVLGDANTIARLTNNLRLGADYLSIAHVNNAITVARGLGIVRDHQNGLLQLLVRLAQHLEHDFRVG